jgi:hypothetical protein
MRESDKEDVECYNILAREAAQVSKKTFYEEKCKKKCKVFLKRNVISGQLSGTATTR